MLVKTNTGQTCHLTRFQLREQHSMEMRRMQNEHQVQLEDLRRGLDPLNEDDSIIDLVTRVKYRHEVDDEMDRRLFDRLTPSDKRAAQAGSSGLQVRSFLVCSPWNWTRSWTWQVKARSWSGSILYWEKCSWKGVEFLPSVCWWKFGFIWPKALTCLHVFLIPSRWPTRGLHEGNYFAAQHVTCLLTLPLTVIGGPRAQGRRQGARFVWACVETRFRRSNRRLGSQDPAGLAGGAQRLPRRHTVTQGSSSGNTESWGHEQGELDTFLWWWSTAKLHWLTVAIEMRKNRALGKCRWHMMKNLQVLNCACLSHFWHCLMSFWIAFGSAQLVDIYSDFMSNPHIWATGVFPLVRLVSVKCLWHWKSISLLLPELPLTSDRSDDMLFLWMKDKQKPLSFLNFTFSFKNKHDLVHSCTA